MAASDAIIIFVMLISLLSTTTASVIGKSRCQGRDSPIVKHYS
jgi:hypothetical protein